MKNGWQKKTLGEVAEFKNGLNYNKNSNGQTLPVVGVGDFQSNYVVPIGNLQSATIDGTLDDEYAIRRNDILTVRSNGSKELVGRCMLVPDIDETTSYSGFVIRIRFDADEIAPRFLLHFLKSSSTRERLTREGGGANISNINQRKLSSLPVPVPPLPEQRRIVGILDEAFDGIATAKATAEKNLQNARALFESHLNAVFTQRGDGWIHTTIGEQAILQRGFDITKRQQNSGSVPVVSSGGIKSYHDKSMVKAPGVVIGRKGTLGKVFYLDDDYWQHDTTLWIKDFKGNDPRFVYYFFACLDVLHLDSGAANPALNRNQVHPIEVDWPPVSQQPTIVSTLDALIEETQHLESIYQRKLAAFDELKKSLLHQAFSGKL